MTRARMEAMDAGLWRSGRSGGIAWPEAAGARRGVDEGQRFWGGKPSSLGYEEGVGGDA